jgi:hypothetical protein
MASTVDVRLKLSEDIARKLHETAAARGVTEASVVEQALDLLFSLDDSSTLQEYWFSVAAMRDDWENMPDDWIADEATDAVPAR